MPSPAIHIGFNKQRETWEVTIPPALSETGKRDRANFSKRSQAEAYKKAEEARIRNDGTDGAALDRVQRDVAGKAFKKLSKAFPDASSSLLLQAVDSFIQAHDVRGKSKTFLEGFDAWQRDTVTRTRNGKPTSEKYKAQLRHSLPKYERLHEMMMCDITPEDVQMTLEGFTPSSKNAHLRVLRACFNYAKQKDWLESSPVRSRLHFAGTGTREPSVLSPEEAARLLSACVEIDRELLGFYVIALFAGIRPTDEMNGLRWENVFADGGQRIWVPSDIAKTRRERHTTIEPTLRAWFEYIKAPRTGLVTPQRNLTKRKRAIQRAAGIVPWPQDVMRHTYASCWMAVFRDEARCRDNMGHRTQDELHRHYRKHLTEEQAKRFWALTPDAVATITRMERLSGV